MSCCTIFKMHDVYSVCFVNSDFRSLTITCIIYTCYKCLACESKMASIWDLIVGSSVGYPLNGPLFPYLKVVGYPLSCQLNCPLYPNMAVVGSLICMANFPWAAHGQPHSTAHWAAHCFMFGSSGLSTELPTVVIHGSSGQPNLHGKIPMGCPLSCPLFSYLKVVGCLLNCPLSWSLFPYMEVVGSLICMAKFPWAAHSVAHVQPMGSDVGSSPVFSVRVLLNIGWFVLFLFKWRLYIYIPCTKTFTFLSYPILSYILHPAS